MFITGVYIQLYGPQHEATVLYLLDILVYSGTIQIVQIYLEAIDYFQP